MANKFLTEYVFDEERIKNDIIDFRLDIAIRGDIALCKDKGKTKVDKQLYLIAFLESVPSAIFNYSVSVAKEYFDEDVVGKVFFKVF